MLDFCLIQAQLSPWSPWSLIRGVLQVMCSWLSLQRPQEETQVKGKIHQLFCLTFLFLHRFYNVKYLLI